MRLSRRGFTLIELLVVIAIIGLLAAIVLASLNSARSKGGDAAIKANLDGLRSQAELVSSSNGNSYANVCSDATVTNQVRGAMNAAGVAILNANGTAGSSGTATCHSSTGAWGVEVPLKSAGYWCVDSTGMATSTAAFSLTTTTDATCGAVASP